MVTDYAHILRGTARWYMLQDVYIRDPCIRVCCPHPVIVSRLFNSTKGFERFDIRGMLENRPHRLKRASYLVILMVHLL